ncbi:hypothetical protein LAG90_18585 [Marinilongibacter aquaticus]|uniref:MauE/DoxX family redox-associated membrane protein n=1 Tax=Marinilongibacter aquaticus TaxID=2975157 RepID=UPI0021BDBFF3|nr:MauE/DoxX family redox-associated membrane protein [Marinilongibacter aquaticus]UBM58808.1 hypothetical protein LAG90_18585 [Marinilongibacter aquaticus]
MKRNAPVLVLLLLWIPVTLDELLHFDQFRAGILQQPFSDSLAKVLVPVLLILEALTAACLTQSRFRPQGLLLSAMLLLAFNAYIALALSGFWKELPCNCGALIHQLNWEQHFLFNLFFLLVSGYGYILWKPKRGGPVGGGATEG